MIRCPMVLERLSWSEHSSEVVYRGRPARRSPTYPSNLRWDVLTFIARVVDHIPEPCQQMVRYRGFYANAARGKRRRQAMQDTPAGPDARLREEPEDAFARRARLSWAKLIRRVYEVDPLPCPFCGTEMRILSFILDFATARAIRKSLQLPAQQPEPLAHAPPRELELLYQTA